MQPGFKKLNPYGNSSYFYRVCEKCETKICELRVAVASCELRVAVASCELQLRVASCELRVASCELRVASCELQVAVANCELQLRVASCELAFLCLPCISSISNISREVYLYRRFFYLVGFSLLSRAPGVRKIITPTVLFDDCEKYFFFLCSEQ